MKSDMLKLLKKNKDEYVSGSNIGESFGVTRAAIWKYINKLKEEGYEIESVPKLGYKLLKCPDILTYEEIKDQLETETIGRNVVHFDTVGSTNEQAKSLASAAKHGTVVISEEQTGGKGRLGRNFVSPKNKGIWMSIILKPDIEPMKVSLITQIGAAAVNNALLDMGIESLIKWPNDIIINNKKVCGILTEMSCELTMVNYVVLGIGINVNVDSEDFGEEVIKVATSLKLETKRTVDRKKLTGYILNNFERLYDNYIEKDDITESISICKNRSILIGKEIRVLKKGEAKKANAVDIKTNGSLVVQYESGEIEELISGEVSIRGKENYV